MLSWYLYLYNIDCQIRSPAVAEYQLNLDRARNGIDMHLEVLFDLESEVWPTDWNLVSL